MSFFGGIRALQQLLTDTSKTEWHFTGLSLVSPMCIQQPCECCCCRQKMTSRAPWAVAGAATERCKPGTKVWEGAYWRTLSDRE